MKTFFLFTRRCARRLAAATMFACLLTDGLPAFGQTTTPPYAITQQLPVFHERMKELLTYPLAWGNSATRDFGAWRAEARAAVESCMGNVPPAPQDYGMRITAREQREGYGALKIEFNVSEWCRVPAYLLVPNGTGPFPALVMLHDHGARFTIGKEKMVRPFEVSPSIAEDAEGWVTRCYDGQYTGDYFARHGYVVLAVDALLWGERGCREGTTYEAQQALAANMLQLGSSWSGFMVMDDLRSADFLSSLPFVDAEKVGCLGFSLGAYRSWMLSSLSDRVKAAASVCWMNTTERLMTPGNNQTKGASAFAMTVPGLCRYMDYPHVAAIACPKPALFFNGRKDVLFPVEGVEDAYAVLQDTYRSQGAEDRLVTRLWDGGHFFSKEMQRETLKFFDAVFNVSR